MPRGPVNPDGYRHRNVRLLDHADNENDNGADTPTMSRFIALRENLLVLLVVGKRSSVADLRQKKLWIERWFRFPFHRSLARLMPRFPIYLLDDECTPNRLHRKHLSKFQHVFKIESVGALRQRNSGLSKCISG
jgi:hypothetical protein